MLSTRQAAKRLGVSAMALSRYIAQGKIPEPKQVMVAGMKIYDWTDEEVECVRQLLPKIANGRKTRWQRARKTQKAQSGAPRPRQAKRLSGAPMPVPHKKKSIRKKK